jgi:glycosyltransferase involved in cell wall biosynthesis
MGRVRGIGALTGARAQDISIGEGRVSHEGESSASPGSYLRVLWFSHTAKLGGAELGILDAARALRNTGVQLHVVLPDEGPLQERLEQLEVSTSVVPYGWWMSGLDSSRWHRSNLMRFARPSQWRRALAAIDRVEPDVVVSNTATIAVGAVAARVRRVPHVWYLREFGAEDHRLRFDLGERFSYRAIDRLSSVVIVVSEGVGRHVARFGLGSKVRQVRYGIQVPPTVTPAVRPEDTFLLTQIATVTASKGQHIAVRALQELAEKGYDVHLRLVGSVEKAYGHEIQRLAKAGGVERRVEITGFRDPYPDIAASDAVLMCSRMEAFGRGTVESMKLGKPVIGSASGATRELIRDGWNGLLFRPGDSSDLADKIKLLYDDPALQRTLGENASEWSNERFSAENYATDLLKIFREVSTRPV